MRTANYRPDTSVCTADKACTIDMEYSMTLLSGIHSNPAEINCADFSVSFSQIYDSDISDYVIIDFEIVETNDDEILNTVIRVTNIG